MIKRYNGTAWNAVTYCKNFNGTEQFTYFPVVANTFANAISSWTIKGNEQHTGTPAPGNPIRGVGEETANLLNPNGTWRDFNCSHSVDGGDITVTGKWFSYVAFTAKPNTTYSIKYRNVLNQHVAIYKNTVSGSPLNTTYTDFVKFTTDSDTQLYIVFYANSGGDERTVTYRDVRLYEGDYTSATIPDYEPYGYYKIPISSGNATTPVYISAPLRKSLDGTVFDTLDSTGLVTYNVDEYGAPLVTPTTATVTVPTITSALGRTVISFGTTIQPSEFDMTYHGWHSHIPSIRSNNAWS